jgi:hypothetical protein
MTNSSAPTVSDEPNWFCGKFKWRPRASKGCLSIILSKWVQVSLVACVIWASSPVQAQTIYSEVINGGTCVPFPVPKVPPQPFAFPFEHSLFGSQYRAYCYLTMSTDWPVRNLSYVEIAGSTPSFFSRITAILCVHSGSSTVTCGPESALSGTSGITLVYPPNLPDFATGAYVQITFPDGASRVFELIPVWTK